MGMKSDASHALGDKTKDVQKVRVTIVFERRNTGHVHVRRLTYRGKGGGEMEHDAGLISCSI